MFNENNRAKKIFPKLYKCEYKKIAFILDCQHFRWDNAKKTFS